MFTSTPSIRVSELLAQGNELEVFPRDGDIERDREKIRETLEALIRHGAPAELTQDNMRVRVLPVAYSAELGILQFEIENAHLRPGPCALTMLGYNALFRCKLGQVLHHGNKLTTPVPIELFRIRQRWQRRQSVENLSIRVDLPGGSSVQRRVRDISYNGLAFYHDDDVEHLLLAGESIVATLLNINGETVRVQARVVEISTSAEGDIYHLRIASLRGRREGWVELVNDYLHPGTKTGGYFCRDVWDLYTDCGYFNLFGKSPEDFEKMERGYYAAVNQLDRAPHLGTQVVWPNPPGVKGANAALSMLRVYKTSWLGFQMAKTSSKSHQVSDLEVLREIHLRAYEHAQQDPSLRWLVAYAQAGDAWGRRLHRDFSKRYLSSGEASIHQIRALQFKVSDLDRAVGNQITVGRPDGQEFHEIVLSIAASHPKTYCEALDLVPERMTMSEVRKLFARAELSRERVVFVIRKNDVAMAAAVAEMSSDGLDVFGLLDIVRLYPLKENSESYFEVLLGECAEWFESKKKRNFCLFLEAGQSLGTESMAVANDMGMFDMTILSAERLPEFFEFLQTVTSPEPAKLQVSQPGTVTG